MESKVLYIREYEKWKKISENFKVDLIDVKE